MAQKRKPSAGGTNRAFYAVLGFVLVGGIAWLLLAGQGDGVGQSGSAPLPTQFSEVYNNVEADSTVGLALGAPDAPVTIVEFADYQCPHCANFGSFTGRLIRQNYVQTGTVRWVLYDYVLGTFPNSVPASLAARCAGEQGNYWGMHDLLLGRQSEWGRAGDPSGVFEELAEQLNLDGDDLNECVADRRFLEEIAKSRKYGDQLAVNSTPTVFLNGRRLDLRTEGSYQALEALIQEAAAAAPEGEDAAAGDASAGTDEDS